MNRSEKNFRKKPETSAQLLESLADQCGVELKPSDSFSTDQRAIWSKIGELANCLKAESPSMEMGAIFYKEQSRLDKYTASFAPLAEQVGAVFAIDGRKNYESWDYR